MPSLTKLTALASTTFAALAGLAVALSFVWIVPGFAVDFAYDWLTSRAVMMGIDPSQPLNQLGAVVGVPNELEILHPRTPGALIVSVPIGVLPWPAVYETGRILVVLSAAALLFITARGAKLRPEPVLLVLPLLMVIWPLSGTLRVGNTGVLIAALIALTWFSSDRTLSGIPLGVALTLKLWPWLIVPALFISGRRKTAIGAAATFAGLNLVAIALPHVSIEGSLRTLQQAQLDDRSLALFPLEVGVAVALVWLLLAWRLHWHPRWSIAMALATAPLVWPAYLPVLLVPIADWFGSRRPPRVQPGDALHDRARRNSGTSRLEERNP